jgi:hypothetical protein
VVALVLPAGSASPAPGARPGRVGRNAAQLEAPATGPSLEIGTIELRLEPPAASADAQPAVPSTAVGFDEYLSTRTYAR